MIFPNIWVGEFRSAFHHFKPFPCWHNTQQKLQTQTTQPCQFWGCCSAGFGLIYTKG